MSDQLEMKLEAPPRELPPLLKLEEFVEQMEREYGKSIALKAIQAALEEKP